MSKQYLTIHTIDDAHPTDVFALSTTSTTVLSASGSAAIQAHSTTSLNFSSIQTLEGAHKVGAHHIVSSNDGRTTVSVGFGGEVKVWSLAAGFSDGSSQSGDSVNPWVYRGQVKDQSNGKKKSEIWAAVLGEDGRYLAATTADGRVLVWDLGAGETGDESRASNQSISFEARKIREFETKGSFGLSIDMSPDGTLTATGHASGSVYLFDNSTSRLTQSLPNLHAPVRAVRFSPGGSLLAAAGDGCIIHLFSASTGEPLALLSGHSSWIFALAFSDTGAHLLSGAWDGRVKVWDVERRECVWTGRGPGEQGPVWAVSWLKGKSSAAASAQGKSQGFVVGGRGGGLRFYREAAGG